MRSVQKRENPENALNPRRAITGIKHEFTKSSVTCERLDGETTTFSMLAIISSGDILD